MAMIRMRKDRRGVRRYQWRVTVAGFAPRYGTCPTKRCAEECSRREEEALRSGLRRGDLTMAELLDQYESTYLPTVRGSASVASGHLRVWRELLGEAPVSQLNAELLARARQRLAELPGAGGRRRAPATVNRYMATLSSALSWAAAPGQQLIASNPALTLRRLPEPKPRVRWLSRPSDEQGSELERLLKALEVSGSGILRDLVLILISTACRKSEVLKLHRRDIRLQEGGFYLRAENTKAGKARFVPLDGWALEVVGRRLREPQRIDNDHLFPARSGPGPASFPKRAWATALRRAGIEDFRPHDLRHTHLSYLAMLGKTLPEIMAAGGHSNPSSAMRYVHLADEHKRSVNAELQESLREWSEASGSSSRKQRRRPPS